MEPVDPLLSGLRPDLLLGRGSPRAVPEGALGYLRGPWPGYVLALTLAAAAVLRVAVALELPPLSDVYYYLRDAAQAFLSGANPYDHAYTGIPSSLVTPGASHVFAYLPMTFVYLSPFYLLGDIRAGTILADLVIGLCLYLYGGRWRQWSLAAFLFLPATVLFSTVYINAGLVSMLFLATSLVLERAGRGAWSAASFGLSLAGIQFSLLLLPLFLAYYARGRRFTHAAIVVAVAAIVVTPFALASPASFFSEVVTFQFDRTPLPLVGVGGPLGLVVNPSLSAVTQAVLGYAVPVYAKVAVVLVILLPLVRVRDLPSLVRNGFLFSLLCVFILPNDFFWAYLEAPFMLFLFWLGSVGSFRS